MGEDRFLAYHRFLFTLYSAAATVAVLLSVRSLPYIPLYRIEGWSRILFHAIQVLGAGLLLWTPWDLKEFFGLRQWEQHRKGGRQAPDRNERFFTRKAYGLVRYPLYLRCSLAPLPPCPDAKRRRHGGGRHRLFLYRDLFRGASVRANVRRYVPGIPAPRAAVLPVPAISLI